MNISTYLKNPKGITSTVIFRFYYKKRAFKFYTGVSVDCKSWSSAKQNLKGDDEQSNEINSKLEQKRQIIKDKLANDQPDIDDVKEIVNSILEDRSVFRPYLALVSYQSPDGAYSTSKKIEDYTAISKVPDDKITLEYQINKYINQNRLIISANRIRHYKSTINLLSDANLNKVQIDGFTIDHFVEFRDSLLKKDRLNDTVNHKIKMVKAVLKDYNKNHPALEFKNIKLKPLKHPILSEEELTKLRKCRKLSPALKRVRDIFLFSCETGQRINDILNLKKEDVEKRHWHLRQGKEKHLVRIPLTDEALKILSKYKFEIPKITTQVYNRELKLMGEKAKLNRSVYYERSSGTKTISKSGIPLYKFISSHMGRRIFITHNLSRSVPVNIIAKITGQTIQTLEKYVQTQDDEADKFFL